MISSFGLNPWSTTLPAPTIAPVGGCPAHGAAGQAPATSAFGGFPMAQAMASVASPNFSAAGTATPGGSERFVQTSTGGVLLGADGAPAGTVAAGAFFDTKSSKLYGADGKQIAIPEGGSVDFFDVPDLADFAKAAATGGGMASHGATGAVPGNLPFYVNPFQQSSPWPAAAAAASTPASTGTSVAGARGGGAAMASNGMHSSHATLAGHPQMPSWAAGALPVFGGGGPTTAVGGAAGLGMTPTLEASIAELTRVIAQLASAVSAAAAAATASGGGPTSPGTTVGQVGQVGQHRPHFPRPEVTTPAFALPVATTDTAATPVSTDSTDSTTSTDSSTT